MYTCYYIYTHTIYIQIYQFLAPSADKQTCNYDTECSNHHPSLSTLGSKGLSHSKMK